MVKNLVLYDKIYNIYTDKDKKEISIRYRKYLNELAQSFPNTKVQIKKVRQFDDRVEILISGPEEVFLLNLFKKEVGAIVEFDEVEINQTYKGVLLDVGKVGFGIFVDCAILNPKTDVLLNLHALRKQLCKGRDVSLTEIIKTYDFIDHFPVEGVFVSGETKGQFKKALIRTGHYRDIALIERFGFLENIVILRQDTNAPGIIADIGKYLKNCKLSAIRPERIRKLFV